MNTLHYLSTHFMGTTLAERLTILTEIYNEAELAMDLWKEKSRISCVKGCGICCERFMPDVLPVEADLIALYLCIDHPETSGRFLVPDRSFCTLYRFCVDEHCPIYPVRPLICRLFGFSAAKGKDGKPVFRLCREISTEGPRQFSETEALAAFGGLPPSMGDFGIQVQSIDADSSAVRKPLPEALEISLKKIRYFISLKNPEDIPPDTPGPVKLPA